MQALLDVPIEPTHDGPIEESRFTRWACRLGVSGLGWARGEAGWAAAYRDVLQRIGLDEPRLSSGLDMPWFDVLGMA